MITKQIVEKAVGPISRYWSPSFMASVVESLNSQLADIEAAAYRSSMTPGQKEAKGSAPIDWSKTDGQEL